MSGDILTVKTGKRVRSVRGSALVHITFIRDKLHRNSKNNLFLICFIVFLDIVATY